MFRQISSLSFTHKRKKGIKYEEELNDEESPSRSDANNQGRTSLMRQSKFNHTFLQKRYREDDHGDE